MYLGELQFFVPPTEAEAFQEIIPLVLSALRLQGRILGREFPVLSRGDIWIAYVLLPDDDALDERYDNQYVRAYIEQMIVAGGLQPTRIVQGEDPTSSRIYTKSHQAQSYILYTDYTSMESPLRCGTTFAGVPLYRIPPFKDDEYQALISWQSDYQACDCLQMNDETAVRCATRELTRLESTLSQRGLLLRDTVVQLTGTPTYYYIMSVSGRSLRRELQRRCPSCGGPWLLDKPWHDIFDFRCDTCYLLSNIAWNVRHLK